MEIVLKMAVIIGWMMTAALPSRAGEPVVLAKLVELAEQRPGFVAILAPSVTNHCMRAVWGQTPPKVYRNWAETLLLEDLANRARVQSGVMSKHQATAVRQALFLSLEQIGSDALKAVELYTSTKTGGEFGRGLTQVMDCQYKAMAAALVGTDES